MISRRASLAICGFLLWGVFISQIISEEIGIPSENYNWYWQNTGCENKRTRVGILKVPDFSDDPYIQYMDWIWFRDLYGLSDDDRLGPETQTYNCHSFILNGSNGLVADQPAYIGSSLGCWHLNNSGDIRSNYGHSMTLDHVGKAGVRFLCANNQKIYGEITTKYKYCW
jgi:hypothetical protein